MGMFRECSTNIYLLGGKKLFFTDNASFRSYISKINNTFVENAEDHDIVMSMYNLLEYSDNHSIIPGGLMNFSRDEVNDFANENESNALINNNETATSKTFNYKLKLIGISRLNIVVVPLKFLSKFWRSLDLPLINCEIELDLS